MALKYGTYITQNAGFGDICNQEYLNYAKRAIALNFNRQYV